MRRRFFLILFLSIALLWPVHLTMPAPLTTPALTMPEPGAFKYCGDGRLTLKNLHLNEVLDVRYKDKSGHYIESALSAINHILRDRLTQEEIPISRELICLVDHIQDHFGGGEVDVISGYRSPELNSRLRAAGRGVALRSLHMEGRALDFRMPGVPTRKIRDYAVSLKAGGVGYYAGSDFVHIDVGRVRTW